MRTTVASNAFASLKDSIFRDPQPPTNRHDLGVHQQMAELVMANPNHAVLAANAPYAAQQVFASMYAVPPEPAQFVGFVRRALAPSGVAPFNALLGFAVANAPQRSGANLQQASARHTLQTLNPTFTAEQIDAAIADPATFRTIIEQQHVALYSSLWLYLSRPADSRAELVSERQHRRFQQYLEGNPDWVAELQRCTSQEAAENLARTKLQGVGTRSVEYVFWVARILMVIKQARRPQDAAALLALFDRSCIKLADLWGAKGKAGVWSMLMGNQVRERASDDVILLREIAQRCNLVDPPAADGPFIDPGLLTPLRWMRIASVVKTSTFSYFSCDWTGEEVLTRLHQLMMTERTRLAETTRLAQLSQSNPPKPFALSSSTLYFLLGMRTHLYVKPFEMPESPLSKFFTMLSGLMELTSITPEDVSQLVLEYTRHMFGQIETRSAELVEQLERQIHDTQPALQIDDAANPETVYDLGAISAAASQVADDLASLSVRPPDSQPAPRLARRGGGTSSAQIQPVPDMHQVGTLRDAAAAFRSDSRVVSFDIGVDWEQLHNTSRLDMGSTLDFADVCKVRGVVSSSAPPRSGLRLSLAFLLLSYIRSTQRLAPLPPTSVIPTQVLNAYTAFSESGLLPTLFNVARGMGVADGANFPFDIVTPLHVSTAWQEKILSVLSAQCPVIHQFLGLLEEAIEQGVSAIEALERLPEEEIVAEQGITPADLLAVQSGDGVIGQLRFRVPSSRRSSPTPVGRPRPSSSPVVVRVTDPVQQRLPDVQSDAPPLQDPASGSGN